MDGKNLNITQIILEQDRANREINVKKGSPAHIIINYLKSGNKIL